MNWPQLRTILWLRWRLSCNQWTRSRGLGAVIAIFVAGGMFVLSTGALAGGFLIGFLALREASPEAVMGTWLAVTLGFLFFWCIGLLSELQRSETIDLQRLLHLPVALGQIFTINYFASHLALSIVVAVPGMLGLAAGSALSLDPSMALLIPLALSVVFMITAWTYCLRGWIAALMTNPRRRRAIIMGVTAGFILLVQGPNLYFNVIMRPNQQHGDESSDREERRRQREERRAGERDTLRRLAEVQKYVPPLWLPVGARGLAEHRWVPALLGTLGCLAIGGLGLQRAYSSTVRFYRGETRRSLFARTRTASPKAAASSAPSVRTSASMVERRLPGVPEQASALAFATLRSLLRAPEVKMAWASSFIVTVVIGGTVLLRRAPNMPEPMKPFLAVGGTAFALFMVVQFLANQFGYDREGFRALVLSPADRRLILLGKNFAALPVGGAFSLLVTLSISVWLRLPLLDLFAAVCQWITLLVLAGLGGNLLSILTPYRIAAGSLKPAKMPALAMVTMGLCHLVFPVLLAPAALPPVAGLLWHLAKLPESVPVNFLFSVALAAVSLKLYWMALVPLGRLLQARETRILQVVSEEVE